MNKTWDNNAIGSGLGSPKWGRENLSKTQPEVPRSTWMDVTPSTGEDDATASPEDGKDEDQLREDGSAEASKFSCDSDTESEVDGDFSRLALTVGLMVALLLMFAIYALIYRPKAETHSND